jgi:hypothetical protein
MDRINELINKHACESVGINISCVPIYYLEPNTRIYVKDADD